MGSSEEPCCDIPRQGGKDLFTTHQAHHLRLEQLKRPAASGRWPVLTLSVPLLSLVEVEKRRERIRLNANFRPTEILGDLNP